PGSRPEPEGRGLESSAGHGFVAHDPLPERRIHRALRRSHEFRVNLGNASSASLILADTYGNREPGTGVSCQRAAAPPARGKRGSRTGATGPFGRSRSLFRTNGGVCAATG